jgi:hypothetical protein
MKHRRQSACLVLAFFAVALSPLGMTRVDAQFGIFRGGGGKVEYQALTAPGGRFTLEYPKKDWRVLPGGGAVALTLGHSKNEAAVVIEYMRLDPPLSPNDITAVFVDEIELVELKQRQPGATNFRTGLMTGAEGKQGQIDFERPGMKGTEHVRQFSLPRGNDLYRIVCSAPMELFPKYEAVFSHIVETFRTQPAK